MDFDKANTIVSTCLLAVLYFCASPASAGSYSPNDYYASIEKANNPDWMSKLSDDLALSDLSIPGTHDSMAFYGNMGSQSGTPKGLTDDITKLQQRFDNSPRLSLERQFQAGIRAIDIRVVFTKSKNPNDPIPSPQFAIHHGAIYQHANFLDVLQVSSKFLLLNPRETILMRLKLEKGSKKDRLNFPSVFDKYRDSEYGKVLYYPSVAGTGSIGIPKLGSVRGKIVLTTLKGSKGGTYVDYGINSNSIIIQDKYEFHNAGVSSKKFKYVVKQFEATQDPANRDKLMINFISATTKFGAIPGTRANGPSAIAHDTNQRVWAYLNNNYKGQPRTGMIMMDYPGWKLIDTIISFNKKKTT